MNRRTFVTRAAAALTLAPMSGRLAAQDTGPEPRWDEASSLFGNAWDVLPKAEEGTAQLLALTIAKPTMMGSSLFGLLHNATDGPRVLFNVASDDASIIAMPSSVQEIVQPGGYSLVRISISAMLEPGMDVPALTPLIISPDEMASHSGTFGGYEPVQVDAASFSAGASSVTITNTIPEPTGAPHGFIMFFDNAGSPTMLSEQTMYEGPAPGETKQSGVYILDEAFDPTQVFLVGFQALPE